jgi:hypothetical protein
MVYISAIYGIILSGHEKGSKINHSEEEDKDGKKF